MKWRACRLGDVITLKRGHDLPDTQRQDGYVSVVSSSGVTGYHSEPKAKAPGVVTGRYGTLGEVFYLDQDYWPLNTALYVTDFKGNHPRFVAYFLENVLRNYQSDKAAVPGVNRNVLHDLKVSCTDPKTQQKIANILSSYDDLIENNRRRMELLEEAARQLYREWFARLHFPGREHTRSSNGVPIGWKRGRVGNLAKIQSGYAFKSKDWVREGNPVIKIGNIDANIVDTTQCECVPDEVAEQAGNFLLKQGDLLIAMTGATVGKIGIMPRTKKSCYLNQRVGVFRIQYEINPVPFLFTFFNTENAKQQVINFAAGAAQPNISPTQIESIKLLIPSKTLLTAFTDTCEPLFSQRLVLIE